MKHMILILTLSLTATLAQAAATSAYTDLQTCKILTSSENDPEAEIDYFTSVCKGREGFDVRLDGGDLRSWISLVKKGTEDFVAENITFSFALGQFPNVAGPKIEWRYNSGKLAALIVRMSGQDPEDYNNELVNLVVVRLNKQNPEKTCVVGVVNAKQANANAKARAVADDLSAACLQERY